MNKQVAIIDQKVIHAGKVINTHDMSLGVAITGKSRGRIHQYDYQRIQGLYVLKEIK